MSNFSRLQRLRGIGGAWAGYALLALVLVVIMPLALDVFRLNLIGKYLSYASWPWGW